MTIEEYQQSPQAQMIVMAHRVLLRRLTVSEHQGLRALLRFRSMHLGRGPRGNQEKE